MKKKILTGLGALAICIGGLATYNYLGPSAHSLSLASQEENSLYAEKGILEIAGRKFEIPMAYVDGKFVNGYKKDSVVLEYVLPDFKSKKEYTKEERMKEILAGNVSSMLLEDASQKPSFDEVTHWRKETKQIVDFEQKIYGLDKYTAPKPEGKYATKPDDTYIETLPDGKIKGYLMCSPPDKDKVPGCKYAFIDKDVLYRIRIPLRELKNWRQQQSAAIKFIDNFELIQDQGK